MSKQKIPLHLRKAIWYSYDRKSGYEGIPIGFLEMEIEHIIPERVYLEPRRANEIDEWKEKYHLNDDFDIRGVENLCPSTRIFNLGKSDKGLDDQGGAYDGHIVRALVKAKELKTKIEELDIKFKNDLNKRNTKEIIDIINLIEKEEIDLEILISEGLNISSKDLMELEDRERYNEILEKYQKFGLTLYNFGEYFEIMKAIRYAVSNNREDASYWIDLFNDFISNVYDIQVKKKAFYERTYAMFKSGESWELIEVEILEYFNSVSDETNLENLRNIAILYGIFFGEFQRERVKTSRTTLNEIRENLLENFQKKIDNSITNVRQVNLKYSKFFIESLQNIEEYELIQEDNLDGIRKWLNRYFFLLNQLIIDLENINYFDFDEFYDTFIGLFEKIPIIKQHPEYDQLFRRISNLKNDYEGIKSTIPNLMKRAIELFEQQEYLKAIEQFHKIKNISYNPHNSYTFVYAIYYIGLCYEDMGLLFASKYYFMISYYMAIELDCEYNTKQLTYALGIDSMALVSFELGEINEMLFYTALTLFLRDIFSLTPIDYSKALNQRLIGILQYIILIIIFERKRENESITFLQKLLERFDLWEFIKVPLEKWENDIEEDILIQFEEIYNCQYNHSIIENSYSWNQLNTKFTIKWDNNYKNTLLAQEFIAYFQIYLSILNEIDYISSSDIILKIIPSSRFNLEYSEELTIVQIPEELDSEYLIKFFSTFFTILEHHMVISQDQIMKEIKPIFEDSYFSNQFREIFKSLISQEIFTLLQRVDE